MTSRIAVFASGRGSNLLALHAHLAEAGGASIVLVASDRDGSGALSWARSMSIATATWSGATDETLAMGSVLADSRIDLVVLAGYLRLIPSDVVRAYRGRMLNVHPALLPAFGGKGMYGARVHRAVLDAGARITGPTVHFVDEIYDHGAIIAQWPVPVFAGDTEHTLGARVLRAEHALLPRVTRAVATGAVSLAADGRVLREPESPSESAAYLYASAGDDALAEAMAAALGA